jgi:hypothetical protein
MDFCYGIRFLPPASGGCTALRHLSIRNNNAIDMVTVLSENPLVLDMIETIELQTSCIYSAWRPANFMKMLQQCTSTHLVFAAIEQGCYGTLDQGEGRRPR